ncbi:hypothetical protein [Novipirellula caenicola]|uniref:Uncharacterized protein n=1 Tax=Novipirellula caenicola TaxID=1536901 RepID=A0ABP9W1N7_9BACT
MMFRIFIAFLFALTATHHLSAEPTGMPVVQLPVNIAADDGEFTLHVDWSKKPDGTVTAYIVNRSKKPIRLYTLYDKCTLKLEAQNSAGEWERAQVHYDELCGAGFGHYDLQPNTWIMQSHGIAHSGTHQERRPVRLRGYDVNFRIASNSGIANVDIDVIEDAKRDTMAIRFANIDELKDIIYERIKFDLLVPPYLPRRPRQHAVWALGAPHHPHDEAMKLLRDLSVDKDQDLAAEAKSVLAQKRDHRNGER